MSKKTENWQVALAAVGIAAYAYFSSGEKSGSESGGVQIPSIFPTGGNGSEPAPAVNNYNVSFPDFSGFDGSSKKDDTIAGSTYAGGGSTNPEHPRLSSGRNLPIISGGTGSAGNPTAAQVLSNKLISPSIDVSRSAISKKETVIAAVPIKKTSSGSGRNMTNVSNTYQAAATKAYGSNVISTAYGGTTKKASTGFAGSLNRNLGAGLKW